MRGAECEPLAIFLRSVPQIPQVWTRTRISPGPTSGTGTSSRRTSFTPRYTAALIVEGISCLAPSTANVDVRAIAIAAFVVSLSGCFVERRASPPGWTLRLRSGQARETPAPPPYDFIVSPRCPAKFHYSGSHARDNSPPRRKEHHLPWNCSAPTPW